MDKIGRDSSVFKSNRLHILISSGFLQFKAYFIDSSEMIDDLPKVFKLTGSDICKCGQFSLIVISNTYQTLNNILEHKIPEDPLGFPK